jgi:hypothetical protein
MATQRRFSQPIQPSMESSADLDPMVQEWLRLIAEHTEAIGELAVAIDHYKLQVESTLPSIPTTRRRKIVIAC